MLQEIGVMLGLYILTRLIPEKRIAWRVMAVLTALVSVTALADLVIRSFDEKGLAAYLADPSDAEAAADASPAAAPNAASSSVTVTRTDGGPIRTDLGYGIVLGKESSLQRQWIAVHDAKLPVDLIGTPGIGTKWVRQEYSGEFRYTAYLEVAAKQPVASFEIRFLVFDVFGDHVQTLSTTQIVDVPERGKRRLEPQWRIFSENEAGEHFASVGYVARVRLPDGRVIESEPEFVLAEARKISKKITVEDLDPKPAPAPGGR